MKIHFPIQFTKKLKDIANCAEKLNIKVYLVGGPVRDILLGEEVNDMDIAVESEDILNLIKMLSKIWKTNYKFYSDFNTATFMFKDKRIDFSMTRSEEYPFSGSLPKVKFATIIEDLKRRDFTINAIAITLSPDLKVKVVDPTGGVEDLKKGLIRIIHNKSFIDDPTRIFRAIRFKNRFRFKLEKNTERKLTEAIKNGYLQNISDERLMNEFLLMLMEKDSYNCIREAAKLGILKFVHPQLNLPSKFKKILNEKRWKLEMSLATFFIGKTFDSIKSILKELEIDRGLKNEILNLFYYIEKGVIKGKFKPWMKKFLELISFKFMRPYISGKDLIKLGFSPGKIFNKILSESWQKQKKGLIKSKRDAIDYVTRKYLQKQVSF